MGSKKNDAVKSERESPIRCKWCGDTYDEHQDRILGTPDHEFEGSPKHWEGRC